MAGFYLDTCVLVSLFHGDSGYMAAESWLAAALPQQSWISHWVVLEFAQATATRLRRGELPVAKVAALQLSFEAFRQQRLALVEPCGRDFLLARDWIQSDSVSGLRAADALHLALTQRQGLRLVSADQGLVRAAEQLGLEATLVG
ncbi:MAG: type II toxin-antitoxin system VapC family toxin [Synechococcaceae cyanobacterium]